MSELAAAILIFLCLLYLAIDGVAAVADHLARQYPPEDDS